GSSRTPPNDPALPLQAQITAQPTQVTKPPQGSFAFAAAGSISMNSTVQKTLTGGSGYRFPLLLDAISTDIRSDLTIATLENICSPDDKLSDANIPVDALTAFSRSGIDALCLGYEGIFNSGLRGAQATMDAAAAAGMTPYGIYASQEARSQPPMTVVNGVSVALLSYQNSISGTGKKKLSKEELTFAFTEPALPTITADIQSAKAKGAQVVVVSLCWGKSGANMPSQSQRDLAQKIADAGADIILGTHSGVVQPVQVLTATRPNGQRSQTLCAYSLGNLFSPNLSKRSARAGIILRGEIIVDFGDSSVRFEQLTYIPTFTWRGKEENQTVYRVLASDKPPPGFLNQEQQTAMKRCLALINEVMVGAPAIKPRSE
ncbi:MAG: CapA family protein, partial [Clostridia bacterium]|nr:CapA family protein [Clostridia bacterium]